MTTDHILPIVLSTVALFFCSALSWMVFALHRDDWNNVPNEDDWLAEVKRRNIPVGSYMFPGMKPPNDMKDPAFQAKMKAGPRGMLTIFPDVGMGGKLGLTVVYFLICSTAFAYLASIAFPGAASFLNVFRFVFTTAIFTFLAATVQNRIWFHGRLTGYVIESILYAAVSAAIFAAMWPK